jgi:hypothetical protein
MPMSMPRSTTGTWLRMTTVSESPASLSPYWSKLVAMYPYFVDYQQRTQREIPVIILRPVGDA